VCGSFEDCNENLGSIKCMKLLEYFLICEYDSSVELVEIAQERAVSL
jgi:hypothetical protein